MPKTLRNKKDGQKKAVVVEDDEYEVEEPINDPMIAMMPMSFGKQEKKNNLAASFARTKRVGVSESASDLQQEAKPPKVTAVDPVEEETDDSDDMIGPMPAQPRAPEEEEEEEDDEFPISHEIVLKDHTKVFFQRLLIYDRPFQQLRWTHQAHG